MNEEEKQAIKSMKEFAYTIHGTLSIKEAQTVLNLLEKKDKQIEEYKTLLAQSTAKRVITSLKDSEKSKEDLKMLNDGWRIECEKKDKIIDEIQKEVRDHIGFENRLKRDNKEPDLFNQGRFYVANNINNILKRK